MIEQRPTWANQSVRTVVSPIMLGVTWLVVAMGCNGGIAQAPRGDRIALAPRQVQPAPVTDDGAIALAGAMRRSLSNAGERHFGEILVRVDTLRNQSHASNREFATLLERLAGHLSRAGAAGRVPMRFVVTPAEPVDYEMGGAVYLVTSAGFDQWELYLNLRAAGGRWTIWTADGPVRMLRQPRGGVDRIFVK